MNIPEQSMQQQLVELPEQRMIQGIAPEALVDAEWVEDNADYVLAQREFTISHPGEVPILIAVGPTGAGKTTQLSNWARADENDPLYHAKLERSPQGDVKKNLILHGSTGQLMIAAAREAGFGNKDEVILDEHFRERGTQILLDAVHRTRQVFTHHPDYNVSIFLDIVGVTQQMDLGTSVVRALANDPLTRFVAPELNPTIEAEALTLRSTIAQNPSQADEIFGKFMVDPGISIEGRVKEFIESCGDVNAHDRHWRDIWEQMQSLRVELTKGDDASDLSQISFEGFKNAFNFRKDLYDEWIPMRMQELGVDVYAPGKFQRTQNQYIPDPAKHRELHTHFDRMNNKRKLPLLFFTGGNIAEDVTAEVVLNSLGEFPKKGHIFTK